MKKILLILSAMGFCTSLQASEPDWVLTGSKYKPYLGCNQRPDNGLSLNWTREVLASGKAKDIEHEGELDKQVLYEGQKRYFSILRWTRPVYNRHVKRLVMHMAAQDLRGRSTIRVMAQVYVGDAGYGDAYVVYSNRLSPSPAGALISNVVNQKRYKDFRVEVSISNGGSCYDYGVATYYFRRVR